jgi:hypothetical protein
MKSLKFTSTAIITPQNNVSLYLPLSTLVTLIIPFLVLRTACRWKFCEAHGPYLACAKGFCDDELIDMTDAKFHVQRTGALSCKTAHA